MKALILVLGVAIVGIALQVVSQNPTASKMNETQKAALASWERFLGQQVKVGQKEEDVEKLMAGKFRDHGTIHYGGTGAYSVVYLIDDYHQISFNFDRQSKLTTLPVAGSKKPWLRFPDGTIVELEN